MYSIYVMHSVYFMYRTYFIIYYMYILGDNVLCEYKGMKNELLVRYCADYSIFYLPTSRM